MVRLSQLNPKSAVGRKLLQQQSPQAIEHDRVGVVVGGGAGGGGEKVGGMDGVQGAGSRGASGERPQAGLWSGEVRGLGSRGGAEGAKEGEERGGL